MMQQKCYTSIYRLTIQIMIMKNEKMIDDHYSRTETIICHHRT